ncbi:MAG TPA: hypothetical protein VJN90_11580, partial [Candidatus Acidoferrales bacterium]|nr:hypothetical protein [Candidatus Acidoferrales bacterium]
MKSLRKLSCGLQQVKLRLLARQIRVKKRQPLLIFKNSRLLKIAQRGPPLVELDLNILKLFLRKLQIQLRYVFTRVGFPKRSDLLFSRNADSALVAGQLKFRLIQLAVRQGR